MPWTRSPANTRRAYSGRSAGSTLGSDGRGLGGRDDATLAAYLAFREQGVLLTGDKLLHRPGTAARLLAALEEAADDPEESYSERVTEKMRSMLGCIQEFLLDIGNFTSPRIARVKW